MIHITININLAKEEEVVVETKQQELPTKVVEKEVNKQIVRKSLGPVPRPTAEVLAKRDNPKLKEEEEAWDQSIKDLQV